MTYGYVLCPWYHEAVQIYSCVADKNFFTFLRIISSMIHHATNLSRCSGQNFYFFFAYHKFHDTSGKKRPGHQNPAKCKNSLQWALSTPLKVCETKYSLFTTTQDLYHFQALHASWSGLEIGNVKFWRKDDKLVVAVNQALEQARRGIQDVSTDIIVGNMIFALYQHQSIL